MICFVSDRDNEKQNKTKQATQGLHAQAASAPPQSMPKTGGKQAVGGCVRSTSSGPRVACAGYCCLE